MTDTTKFELRKHKRIKHIEMVNAFPDSVHLIVVLDGSSTMRVLIEPKKHEDQQPEVRT